MNKIIIENDKIIKEIDDTVSIKSITSNDIVCINNLYITVNKTTNLEIIYNVDIDYKLCINYDIGSDITVNIYEKYLKGNVKVKNIYNISKYSEAYIQKFHDLNIIKQFDVINLDGENSKVNYILKAISTNDNIYNLVINHNAKYSSSNIINNVVNIEAGKVLIDVNGIVPKGNIGCILNQSNRIISLNNNKCQINPNLLIDENDVVANHSAFVGKFDEEQLFYLQSRGISYNDALKLLIKGFIIEGLKLDNASLKEIEDSLNKYWR